MQFFMMIEFNQVSKKYDSGFEALRNVDFSLAKGEMAFLTGHSGAGKSTLLKLIAMLEMPTSGQIVVNDVKIGQLKKYDIAKFRANLGIILQSSYLLNDRSVFENVALPLKIQGLSAQLISKRVNAALDKVGLLNKGKVYPCHLSGGERQRVGIARAVVHKPKILLADEPTGNLDPGLSTEVMQIFQDFNSAGVSILIATHDLAMIAIMRHRIFMLKGGRLC
jgi:cell division transport system ATP-binding protein